MLLINNISGDAVFLADERLRKEYVLNDIGKIYIGNYKNHSGRRWVYGQYDDAVLPACMTLLERSRLSPADRANPIKVVRVISALVSNET
jgi:transglutaminase 1